MRQDLEYDYMNGAFTQGKKKYKPYVHFSKVKI